MFGETRVSRYSRRAKSTSAQWAWVISTPACTASASPSSRVHFSGSATNPSAVKPTPSTVATAGPGADGTAQEAAGFARRGANASRPLCTVRPAGGGFGVERGARETWSAARPTWRNSSIITAMPRCTSTSALARTIPTTPSGAISSRRCTTSAASAAIASTSGRVTARIVSRMRTRSSPSVSMSSGWLRTTLSTAPITAFPARK